MKCRMTITISGSRNGQDWPAAGEVIVVPDAEGADLVNAGLAVEAHGSAPVESAVAPASLGTAIMDTSPKRRKS